MEYWSNGFGFHRTPVLHHSTDNGMPRPYQAILLIAFGALALIGYKVTRANLRNGAVVAGIAGVALIVVAGGTVGLVTGLLVFAGALWGLLKSF